jgi:RNA polymerase sigma-70 factor (ECF subfamily)
VVRRLQDGAEDERREAWEVICRGYWKPVYAWLRARGTSPEDAEDLTQEFFSRLHSREWLREVRSENGKLRAFLLVLLKRQAANEWERRNAKKRGGGAVMIPMDAGEAENSWQVLPADGASPDVIFERQWALQLLESVMNDLRAAYERNGKAGLFDELRDYLSGGSTEESYAAPAARLGLSEGTVKVAAFRLRERYRERLRAAVTETVESPDGVNEELEYLFRVFR